MKIYTLSKPDGSKATVITEDEETALELLGWNRDKTRIDHGGEIRGYVLQRRCPTPRKNWIISPLAFS